MAGPEILVPIAGILAVFSIPVTAIWTAHKRQMLEMQMRMKQEGDVSVRAAVDELRAEVRSLKDTTMQYDLSFDTALQRMESRVEGMERRLTTVEANRSPELRSGL